MLATSAKVSADLAPAILEKKKHVVDLSGAFRLATSGDYSKWYGFAHPAPALLERAHYGLPELFGAPRHEDVTLVANPGCYPTAALLPLAPLLKGGLVEATGIIIDAKSGVTGAGRQATEEMSFAEVDEDLRAYRVLGHQHTPEMKRMLARSTPDVTLMFTPHLLPDSARDLATCYARPRTGATKEQVAACLADAYAKTPFVHAVAPERVTIARVAGTNPRARRRDGRCGRGDRVRRDRQPREGGGGAGRAELESPFFVRRDGGARALAEDRAVRTPLGFSYAGMNCGIKAARKDLALVASDRPCIAAGSFTVNRARAAPVIDAAARLPSSKIHAVVVNSGNANALTGVDGEKDVREVCAAVGAALGVAGESVLAASTGVIGVRLPVKKLVDAAEALCSGRGAAIELAAEAILTTDTRVKLSGRVVRVGDVDVTLAAFAKGSGMIAPELATMLAFITTDAVIEEKALAASLAAAMPASFNSITVDDDMSTNDAVFALANGAAGNTPIAVGTPAYDAFAEAVEGICVELARAIAEDGEGATKLVEVRVSGAPSVEIARDFAKSIAGSNLTKAAIFGADPNWGRVLAPSSARAQAHAGGTSIRRAPPSASKTSSSTRRARPRRSTRLRSARRCASRASTSTSCSPRGKRAPSPGGAISRTTT